MDTPNTDENPYPGGMQVNLDTTTLTNATHTLQVVGYINSAQAVVSPAVTIQTNNDLGGLNSTSVVETDSSDFASFDMPAPAGTQLWRAELRDSNNVLLTDWQSTTPQIKLTWNGTDAFGNPLPDGNYTINFATYDANGEKQIARKIAKLTAPPIALSLIAYTYLDDHQSVVNTEELRRTIQSQFDSLARNNAGFTGLAIITNGLTPKQLRYWLSSYVDIFHLVTHGAYGPAGGVAQYAEWNTFTFRPGHLPPTNKAIDSNSKVIYLSDEIHREYSFVFMDFCHSGGGGPRTANDRDGIAIATPDYTWAHAFRINSDGKNETDTGAFWGWNGTCGTLTKGKGVNGVSDNWYYWRLDFWDFLYYQYSYNNIVDAGALATRNTIKRNISENFFPWDQNPNTGDYRALISGDDLIDKALKIRTNAESGRLKPLPQKREVRLRGLIANVRC